VRLGVVADTHGVLHPGVPAALSDVARILHAGDVGGGRVLEDLARLAPVDAVRGNVDPPAGRGGLPDGRVLDLGGRRILLVHAFPSPGGYHTDPTRLDGAFRRRLARLGVEVVCFGHSHRAFVGRVGRVLFVNPGGAGRKRFSLPRSVALLDLAWPEARAEIVPLSPP
jgi:putative phosphoesterase